MHCFNDKTKQLVFYLFANDMHSINHAVTSYNTDNTTFSIIILYNEIKINVDLCAVLATCKHLQNWFLKIYQLNIEVYVAN